MELIPATLPGFGKASRADRPGIKDLPEDGCILEYQGNQSLLFAGLGEHQGAHYGNGPWLWQSLCTVHSGIQGAAKHDGQIEVPGETL